jgi:hypothetical protein
LVRIRIADGKKIFKCCLNFFKISIQVLPTVLQSALLCMQFERFCRQYYSRCQANILYYFML